MTDDPATDDGQADRVWVWCRDCGPRHRLEFATPDVVRCHSCGRIVGRTDRPVRSDLVHLDASREVVVDSETGEALASVEWDADSVVRSTGR